MKWRRAAASVTFQLSEINNEGDYRNHTEDTHKWEKPPGRVLEGWQPASNNGGPGEINIWCPSITEASRYAVDFTSTLLCNDSARQLSF